MTGVSALIALAYALLQGIQAKVPCDVIDAAIDTLTLGM